MKLLYCIQFVLLFICCASGSPLKPSGFIKQCSFSSDCSPGECCVLSRDKSGDRMCTKKPELYDVCSPALFPGLDYSCPCSHGLTCALSDREKRYNCVPVPEMEEEKE